MSMEMSTAQGHAVLINTSSLVPVVHTQIAVFFVNVLGGIILHNFERICRYN